MVAAALALACATRMTDISAAWILSASLGLRAGAANAAGLAFAVLLHAQQLLPQIAVGLVPLATAARVRRRNALAPARQGEPVQ